MATPTTPTTSQAIPIPVILNGVTGRMGTNQHLIRSILAIRSSGGLPTILSPDNTPAVIIPHPLLLGRSLAKVNALAATHGLDSDACFDTLEGALSTAKSLSPTHAIYFDASSTSLRYDSLVAAIKAGLHVYAEKPLASTSAQCGELAKLAGDKGVCHGVVQDKLYLPGLLKLRRLLKEGVLGEVLSVRGEFGYWVEPGIEHQDETNGEWRPQRPSWNYKHEEGGGIISDMLCHWQYLIEGLFGRVESVSCTARTHVKERRGENGEIYQATADDAAYAIFEVEGGAVVQMNSSWCVRVRRDDLLCLQVDGTKGSCVVGLRECWLQKGGDTPRVTWNPDIPPQVDYWQGWEKMQWEDGEEVNAFRAQWEGFLRYVVAHEEWKHGFEQGQRGVAMTEAAEKSSKERRWVDI
jgi:predicted dehydrogenase